MRDNHFFFPLFGRGSLSAGKADLARKLVLGYAGCATPGSLPRFAY